MNKARAFNPFLCAATDKLMALIAEVQVQMSGYEFFHKTRTPYRGRRLNPSGVRGGPSSSGFVQQSRKRQRNMRKPWLRPCSM
jgi:hypothetical protein